MPAKLISIIGPPAAGKTTLAGNLAAKLPAALILEDFANNPFLAESYCGKQQCRLPNELYFLLSRVGQLTLPSLPDGLAVSDYGFCQNRIFAKRMLNNDDFRLYERLADRLESLVKPPDVIINLDACNQTLLGRIDGRGRDFERVMDEAFLDSMRSAYAQLAAQASCHVIRIDCDSMDLLQPHCLDELIEQLTARLGS